MPTYCFEMPDGTVVEREYPMGDVPREVRLENGVIATRSFQAEHLPRRAGGGWPLTCFASGVHPEQAGELRKYLSDKGCPTEVTRNGDPVYRNARHRNEALKLRGMHDRNSFN